MNEAIDKRGYKEITASAMQDAGFVNVVEKIYKWPMNAYHKDWKGKGKELKDVASTTTSLLGNANYVLAIACHLHTCAKDYIKGLSAVLLCDVMKLSRLKMELLLIGVEKEMKDKCNVAVWEM